jgi:zinc protease
MTVKTFTLDNGMQLLLEENRSAPVISFNALVKVGSSFETDAEAGMCHVIEHMLFKGTPTRPVGAIARDIEAAGGEINAYTSFDQTVYYINMAMRFADRGLAILADALQHPLFDENELAREKEVILEEIRREKDNPGRMVGEILFKSAFERHPYGRPIIGSPETVKSFKRSHLIDFYKRWYVPKNISFIVVGDFDTDTMLEQIRRTFAHFEGPPPPMPQVEAIVEPPQKEMRIVVEHMNIQSTYVAIAYHIPAIIHPDVPSLDAMSHILGGTESSRLEQIVKEKKHLVHQISAISYTPKDPGIFTISTVLNDENLPRAFEAIQIEIDRMCKEPVLVSELSRAKLNIRSNEIYEKETVGGQAGKLTSFLAAAGTHEFESRYYQMLMDVRAENIRQVAKRYIRPENCTVAIMTPHGSPWAKQKKRISTALGYENSKKAKPKLPKEDSNPVREFKLRNGIKVYVRENHNLPLVSVSAAWFGGTRFETTLNNGISDMAARLLTKGTKTRDAVTIAKEIERLAGHIEGLSGRNTIGLRCQFISDYISGGVELFCDILAHPSFAPHEVAQEKHLLLQTIKDQEDMLGSLAFIHFMKTLYPKHPYGLRVLGETRSVKKMTPSSIKHFYEKLLKSGGVVMSVVGDVSPKEIIELLEKNLCDLPKGKSKGIRIPVDPRPQTSKIVEIKKKEKQQAHIVLGFQGTTFTNPDRYTMAVLNNILAGQGGRLFLQLRDRMSLAYAVSSMHVEGIEPGHFAVYIGTEPGKIDIAVKGILAELGKILSDSVSADELSRSQQYLVGTYELDSQRIMALASSYTFNSLYGLGVGETARYPKKIMAVTREDVSRVAKKYITPDAYVLSIVKPE